MPKLQIIIASTRPQRVGAAVARWFEGRARQQGEFDIELVDLAEVNLPFLDEPKHPRFGDYVHQHTKDWSAKVDSADAFVFVMPEYNHGFNAPLKNAIDFLHREWTHKPVGFVSYGGVAAGTRAVQMLKPILVGLKMTSLVEAVAIPFVAKYIDEQGVFQADEITDKGADAMLAALLPVAEGMRMLRQAPA